MLVQQEELEVSPQEIFVSQSVNFEATFNKGNELSQSLQRQQRPNPMGSFIAGSTSAVISCLPFQPLDLVKTKLQALPLTSSTTKKLLDGVRTGSIELPTIKSRTISGTIALVIRQDSVLGLWRGLTPSLYRTVPGVGMYFCTLHTMKSFYKSEPTFYEDLMLGFSSRATVATVVLLFTVVTARIETDQNFVGIMRGAVRPSKKVILQVLWTGVDGNIPCLYLFTDTKRYIFNCSEGLQRLFNQYRIKIGKLDTFFFTRHHWSHMGGFPGFALTLRDAKRCTASTLPVSQQIHEQEKKQKKNKTKSNVKERPSNFIKDHVNYIHVHGPVGLKSILSAAARSFFHLETDGTKLKINEYSNDTIWQPFEDNEMTIHSFPIHGSVSLTKIGGTFPKSRLIESLRPSLLCSPPSVCYSCHLKPLPGRFLPKKAKELGVPAGPLFGQLTQRQKVTLPNGTVISPEQVMEDDIPGMVMMVVDIPSETYINDLRTNTRLSNYITTQGDDGIQLVLHLSNETVCSNQLYKQWIDRFPGTTKHIFLHGLMLNKVVFSGQSHVQEMLNYVDDSNFPLIDTNVPLYSSLDEQETLFNFSSLNLREFGTKSPSCCYDHSQSFKQLPAICWPQKAKDLILSANEKCLVENNKFSKTCQTSVNNEKTNDCTSLNVNRKRPSQEDASDLSSRKRIELDTGEVISINNVLNTTKEVSYPKVVCLGTGAAIPSKYRNVSSTLLLIRKDTAVMFDSGEDTYGQLCRHYGNRVNDILNTIKIILISHMHADHHLGLFTMVRKINALKQDRDEDLFVVAPGVFKDWFSNYGEVSELLNCQFVRCTNLYTGSKLYEDIKIQAVKVNHPAQAYGYVVSYGNKGDKVVYSGDTLPCEALIHEGMNCTLLIHEATLESVEEALSRKHSTPLQALDVGERMQAKYVLLTHFSQRYPKIPNLDIDVPIVKRTAIAFDHLEISFDAIPHFHKLLPQLIALFEEPIDEDKEDIGNDE